MHTNYTSLRLLSGWVNILGIRYLVNCDLSVVDSLCAPSLLTHRWKSSSTDASRFDHGSSNRLIEFSTGCGRLTGSGVCYSH